MDKNQLVRKLEQAREDITTIGDLRSRTTVNSYGWKRFSQMIKIKLDDVKRMEGEL